MARKLFAALLVALVTSTAGSAAQAPSVDLNGAWSGSIRIPEPGRTGDKTPLHAALRHSGVNLTGTIGPSQKSQLPISKGRVEATKFGTVITFDMPGPSFVMHFELRAADGMLRGHARLDNERVPAPVELQLVK